LLVAALAMAGALVGVSEMRAADSSPATNAATTAASATNLTAAPVPSALEVSPDIVTRAGTLGAVLKLNESVHGDGQLKLTWTDSFGRTVAEETQAVKVNGNSMPIHLPLARAVVMLNTLEAQLTVGGKTVQDAKADFIVTPDGKWDDYEIVMYNAYKTPEQQRALRDLGVTSGHLNNSRTQNPNGGRTWWENNYRYNCDQICIKFLAAYHDPGCNPKEKLLSDAKTAFNKDRTNKEALYRKPCFFDTDARTNAMARMRKAATVQMRFKPLYYCTDECGVADLVKPFDFCFDPRTLKVMRPWLVEQYGSLDAINAEWGTTFATLDDVVPLTTDEAMARKDGNYSGWADHRFFMNKTFADAVKETCDAVKSVDKDAIAGIEGCQMPSAFGGYDYWRLSQAMDTIEPYNIGNSRELWRSFAPDKPASSTTFGTKKEEIWRLWYEFLHGDRGVCIYDEKNVYLTDDAKPTDIAAKTGPTYHELTGGIGKQFAGMERINDPIAIHYSHPSVTAYWLFEHLSKGKGWVDASGSGERNNSDFLRLRQSAIYLIEDNLFQYKFVSYAQLENGAFDTMDTKVMFLPQSIAMSKAECDALRRFVERGGTLVADCRTALMDGHCKTLAKGQLDDLFGIERSDTKFAPGPAGLKSNGANDLFAGDLEKLSAAEPGIKVVSGATALFKDDKGTPAVICKNHGKGRTIYLNAVVTDYHRWRQKQPEGETLRTLVANVIKAANVSPSYAITQADGKPVPTGAVEVHPWQHGDMRILGLHRNYGLHVNELGPPEYQSQGALEVPVTLKVDFPADVAVYNTREGKFLGMQKNFTVTLDKYQPSIFTILPKPVGTLKLEAPKEAKPGELVAVKLALEGTKPGNFHAFRVEALGPDGNAVQVLTATLSAPGGTVVWNVPFAMSDKPGDYTLNIRDVATGTKATHKLALK
jgi:hypothetical protein